MKILLACGGTAGHIFPALSLAEELIKEEKACSIIIVASTHPRDKRFLKGIGCFKNIQLETVGTSSLPYGISFNYIPFTLRLITAVLKSFYIILKYRPDVAVGFGGYASFAPLIVARLFGIPTLIHEQNLIPGRANRFLARVVDKVAISFSETNKFFPAQIHSKVIKTGLPLRKHILAHSRALAHPDRPKADSRKFTILVVGGSQGAHNINEMVLEVFNRLDEKQRTRMRVIHLTGKTDFAHVRSQYQTLGFDCRVFDFLEDMAGAYGSSDLLIGRSGAGTIFEAAAFGLPCILIPHSYGTGHQKENAFYLKHIGAALVLDEQAFSIGDLEKALRKIIEDKRMRQDLSQRIRPLADMQAGRNLKQETKALYEARYGDK